MLGRHVLSLFTSLPPEDELGEAGLGTDECTARILASAMLGRAVRLLVGPAVRLLDSSAGDLLGRAGKVAFTLLELAPSVAGKVPAAAATTTRLEGDLCKPRLLAACLDADLVTGGECRLWGVAMDQPGGLPSVLIKAPLPVVVGGRIEHLERLPMLILPVLSAATGLWRAAVRLSRCRVVTEERFEPFK